MTWSLAAAGKTVVAKGAANHRTRRRSIPTKAKVVGVRLEVGCRSALRAGAPLAQVAPDAAHPRRRMLMAISMEDLMTGELNAQPIALHGQEAAPC